MAEQSRLQDIYVFLQEKGFNVYFPAQKVGECTESYVVVKDASTSQFGEYSSTVTYYDLMCYVPKDQFSQLEPFVDSVDEAMKGMRPMIKPTYSRTPSFYDEDAKAYMISTQYKNYRQIIV